MDINKIRNELINEKNNRTINNLYYYTIINFIYNQKKLNNINFLDLNISNLETDELDNIIEARNCFPLFDYILDNIDNELSMEMILKMHTILMQGTNYAKNPLNNVGGFKVKNNVMGALNIKTTTPKRVPLILNKIINGYNNLENKTIEDIINFHFLFESIHPFSDGNGRIGRIIMFKECLKNNLMPFIINDRNKEFYIRGLMEYRIDSAYLIDTIKYEQDMYEEMCKSLLREKCK